MSKAFFGVRARRRQRRALGVRPELLGSDPSVTDAQAALRPGGQLVIEVAEGQAPWLAERLSGGGYEEIEVTRDLRGIERVVTARSPR